jgi:hypothetical protein
MGSPTNEHDGALANDGIAQSSRTKNRRRKRVQGGVPMVYQFNPDTTIASKLDLAA